MQKIIQNHYIWAAAILGFMINLGISALISRSAQNNFQISGSSKTYYGWPFKTLYEWYSLNGYSSSWLTQMIKSQAFWENFIVYFIFLLFVFMTINFLTRSK